MSKRHTGRKLAMQVLYQADVQQQPVSAILDEFVQPSAYVPETKDWATELATGTASHQADIDVLISHYAVGWVLDRINPIDRNILRLAFYELIYMKTHPNIVINEALEIAKKYATEDSSKFINGILGNYVKEHPCSPA